VCERSLELIVLYCSVLASQWCEVLYNICYILCVNGDEMWWSVMWRWVYYQFVLAYIVALQLCRVMDCRDSCYIVNRVTWNIIMLLVVRSVFKYFTVGHFISYVGVSAHLSLNCSSESHETLLNKLMCSNFPKLLLFAFSFFATHHLLKFEKQHRNKKSWNGME
jgi:hypothetical protein